MTTTDDVYAQKAELARKLGIEQTKYDQLQIDYANLKEDYKKACQFNKDLNLRFKQLEERLEELRASRPSTR